MSAPAKLFSRAKILVIVTLFALSLTSVKTQVSASQGALRALNAQNAVDIASTRRHLSNVSTTSGSTNDIDERGRLSGITEKVASSVRELSWFSDLKSKLQFYLLNLDTVNKREIFKSNTFFAWAKFLENFIEGKPAYATIHRLLSKRYKSKSLLAVCIRDEIQKLEQVHATQVHAGGIIDPSLLYDNSMDKVTFLRNLEKKQFESWKRVNININALMEDPKLVGENDKETLAKILKDYVDYKTGLHQSESTPLAT